MYFNTNLDTVISQVDLFLHLWGNAWWEKGCFHKFMDLGMVAKDKFP